MIPKSYIKNDGPKCQHCKFLISGAFCFFGETKDPMELLSDPKWKQDNEVYVGGCCKEYYDWTYCGKN